MNPLHLYPRADDMGLNEGSNHGVLETALHGITRNISLMVVTPGFPEAIEMLHRHRPKVALGLHITLTSEWAEPAPRWGPAAPVEEVPSLVQADGTFFRSARRRPEGHRYSPDEVLVELEAQYQRCLGSGLPFSYFDSHMVTLGVPELAGVANEFARRTGWIDVDRLFPNLPKPDKGRAGADPEKTVEGCREALWRRLDAAEPGHYRVINHPAVADESMRLLSPGAAAGRDLNRRFLLEPGLEERLRKRGVFLGRFDQSEMTDPNTQ